MMRQQSDQNEENKDINPRQQYYLSRLGQVVGGEGRVES